MTHSLTTRIPPGPRLGGFPVEITFEVRAPDHSLGEFEPEITILHFSTTLHPSTRLPRSWENMLSAAQLSTLEDECRAHLAQFA